MSAVGGTHTPRSQKHDIGSAPKGEDTMGNVVYQYIRYGAREERLCDDVEAAIAEAIFDIELGQALPMAIIAEGQIVLDEHWIRRAHRENWFANYDLMSADRQPRQRSMMN